MKFSSQRRSRLPFGALLLAGSIFVSRGDRVDAGLGVWTPFGPDGGAVTALSAVLGDSSVVFAGTYDGGIFRSANEGRTWRAVNDGLGQNGVFGTVLAIEIDPRDPNRVYAGTGFGASYRSVDGGQTWALNGTLPVSPVPPITALLADPHSAGTVYAGTRGVYRSRDDGRTWRAVRRGLPAGLVHALDFDPTGRDLYAGLDDGGLYRSGDQGTTWIRVNSGIPSTASVNALGFDPRSPTVVFAATGDGLYRSLDRGRHWSRVGASRLTGGVVGVGFQTATDRAFAASTNGVFVSLDRGNSWSPVEGTFPQLFIRTFAVTRESLLAASGDPDRDSAIERSDDGGVTWRRSDRHLSTLSALELVFHPSDPATFWVSTGQTGLFQSTDGGVTWNRLRFDPAESNGEASGIAVEPSDPRTLYAGKPSSGNFVRSDDGGRTWREPNPGFHASINLIEPDPRAPESLWAGGFGSALHSSNGGRTWDAVNFSAGLYPWILDIEVDPSDPRVVTFAGAKLIGARVPQAKPIAFHTEDGGATWKALVDDSIPGDVVLQFASGRRAEAFYAATGSGLYRTDDRGATWDPLLDFQNRGGGVVATPEALYAARSGAGILRSLDRGASWTPIRRGLGLGSVSQLWTDPHDPRHLFAATRNAGLFEYTSPPTP